MYYWLVAASIGLFGDGEAAARFPAALMAVATSVMLYFSVSNIFSERAGFWASIVLTTCVEFFYLGKAAVTDTTLLFFMTAALLCYQHKWYWVMYIAMALATVTKGPIGIVFPGAIIFLHLLFTGNLREILKMHVIRGLVVYFAIAAPWYYLMYQAHGMEFINTFLGFHNLTRFTTPEHPDRVLWWYYLPVIILGMFPWTGLLLQSIRASISEASSEELVKMSFSISGGYLYCCFSAFHKPNLFLIFCLCFRHLQLLSAGILQGLKSSAESHCFRGLLAQ